MSRTFPFRAQAFRAPALIWLALAVVVGLLAATQPPAVTAVLLALAAFALLGAITPLSALAALLILAPLRNLVATEAPGGLPLDVGQIAFLALVGFWVIHSIARHRTLPVLRPSIVQLPVVIFIIATALTAFTALSLGAWLNEWLKWVSVLLLIAICLDLGSWHWIIFALVLSGVANAVIGIYEFFGGSGALHLLISNRFFRAFGTFGQPNPFGGFMGLIAPIALMAALGYACRVWAAWRAVHILPTAALAAAAFYALSSVLLVAGLVMSWSRGAWLGFAAALLAILFALPRRWSYGAAAMAVVVALIVFLWINGLLPASVVSRIESATDELVAFNDARGIDINPDNFANVERLAHWQAAFNMAQSNPWLGVGFGNYEIAYSQYNLINWKMALGHAHNYYLNVFAEAGIIGLISYVALWLTIMALTWRARRHPDPLARLIAVGLLGTWTYLAVHSLTDNLYVNNLFLHLGVLLGVLALLYRFQNAKIIMRME
ncbi:MAG: O-antigen ligase family protein [Chloroflexota bacterium]